jgi:Putative Ig domain
MANTARIAQDATEFAASQSGTLEIGQDAIEFLTGAGIDCGNPPAGMVGSFYSHTFAFGGGTPPYTFAIIAGALPAGITLDTAAGVISGSPSATGTSAFTVQITDIMGTVQSVACSVTVNAAPTGGGGGGGVPVLGCQCCPTIRSPLKRRKRKTEFDAVPPGGFHVAERGTVVGPANVTPVLICQHQVANNRRFQLTGLVAIASSIAGWTPGDGNVIFRVTISRTITGNPAQGVPFTDYGQFAIPLGALDHPWQIPQCEGMFVQSREIVRLTVQTDPAFIMPGANTRFVGVLKGYEWGVE